MQAQCADHVPLLELHGRRASGIVPDGVEEDVGHGIKRAVAMARHEQASLVA